MKSSYLHLALVIVWLILGYPTIFWWDKSILWVSVMSLYAIIVTHWSGWEAAKAKETIEKAE